jgi:hypothetical protein
MRGMPSAERIVKDIEFEILLGAIPRENFGDAILAIKAHQGKLREEVLETLQDSRVREAFSKVFQIHDMLIVLLQEMSKTIVSLQASLPKIIEQAPLEALRPEEVTSNRCLGTGDSLPISNEPTDITKFLRPDFLRLDLEVRPSRLPVIGKLVQSIKIALHHLVLFYVNRLGSQQAHINKMYGEQILELFKVMAQQQEQINSMGALINELLARIQPGKEA